MPIVTIHIEGISPLLCHNPAGISAPQSSKVGTKKSQIPTPEEEGEAGTYRLPTGALAFPSTGFRGCLASAAKGRKIGKAFATQLVKGAVFNVDELTALLSPDGAPVTEYELDIRRAVVGKASIPRVRPKIMKWAADVQFDYDDEFLSEAHLRELFSIGGRTVGVGDFRPEKSGPFGRFVLA